MRNLIVLLCFTLTACAVEPDDSTPPDTITIDVDPAAAVSDDVSDVRPGPEPLPACADVEASCASGGWDCSVCALDGTGGECLCYGQPEIQCVLSCGGEG